MPKRFAGFIAVLFCAVLPEYSFQADDNYLLSVEQAQTRAIENNKLLLVVLGAQWCHRR
ncbi:hypothetical protein [Rheinheimera sp. MMS21-TC3]|uniref:hypothetical protein n=1 Tax=Rheinheimera sp. MMS21-TC3 TaxID=3072790 RepID=UPI0028C506D2|nr:hypothetical protein [Rheinheimera sp. MMS21-TC3]WNO61323.1 hypothetical protein RDV63_10270 [Rheinheimera sp. MMS21-TC3]